MSAAVSTAGSDGPAPLVSVVIIFLDAGPFLADAIGSVRAQTLESWELVLVDDGSTDASTAIARAAEAGAPGRIRYLEHPGHANLGTSASREIGLRAARGTLLLYLDADDILFADGLATLERALDAHPGTDAAFGATLFWHWHPALADRVDTAQYLPSHCGTHAPPSLLRAMTRDEDLHPANCSSLFRRQALLDVGGFEPAFSGMYEDTVLLAKVLLERRAVMIPDCVSAYRMHPESQCHRAAAAGTYDPKNPNRDRDRYLRWLRRHVAASSRRRDTRLRLAIARQLAMFDHRMLLHALRTGRRATRAGAFLARRTLRPAAAAAAAARAADTTRAAESEKRVRRLTALDALARTLRLAGAATEADRVDTRRDLFARMD